MKKIELYSNEERGRVIIEVVDEDGYTVEVRLGYEEARDLYNKLDKYFEL